MHKHAFVDKEEKKSDLWTGEGERDEEKKGKWKRNNKKMEMAFT